MHIDKCMDEQVSKLFALTEETVTQGMLVIPYIQKIKTLGSYWESNKIRYYLEVYLFQLNS